MNSQVRDGSMTPNALDVLWHYYVSDSKHPRYEAIAVQEALNGLIEHGLIEYRFIGGGLTAEDREYRCTARGVAHVQQLCNLPFPKQVWVDSNNNVIKGD